MKNPTRKTLLKVTMYMMTTMTTVQRLVLRIVWSCFSLSTVHFVCMQGVLRSLQCRCLLLGEVLRQCVGLCSKPVLKKKGRKSSVICFSVEFFHVGLRVSLVVHAHWILLILEVALHDCSAIVLLREFYVISCSFVFFRFCRFSIASTYLIILQC